MLCWAVRIVLVLYASLVASSLPENIAREFSSVPVRIVVVLLILGLSLYDRTAAILMAVGFVISIQTANKYHISALANTAATSGAGSMFEPTQVAPSADTFYGGDNDNSSEEEDVGALKNVEHTIQHLGSSVKHEFDDLVSSTAQHLHLQPHEQQHHHQQHQQFTTKQQLQTAQTNLVQDNQLTEVRTWKNEMGPQGISQPSGYAVSPNLYDQASPFNINCPVA